MNKVMIVGANGGGGGGGGCNYSSVRTEEDLELPFDCEEEEQNEVAKEETGGGGEESEFGHVEVEEEPLHNHRRRRRKRIRRRLLRLAIALILIVLFCMWFTGKTEPQPLATCNDCYCIADDEDSNCPSQVPKSDYTTTEINQLASQNPTNTYEIDCNPFHDDNCQTTPPQDEFDDEVDHDGHNPVCGIHYYNDDINHTTCSNRNYYLKSYKNTTLAETADAFITHYGMCGVCSTTQDLAAYLRIQDLTSEGIVCGKKALLGFHAGVQCYEKLGFTTECSKMWIYNNYNTWRYCAMICATQTMKHKPYNDDDDDDVGDEKTTCELNPCLQCDETYSGPIFQKIAGRTRRNSGLRSAIARPCSSIAPITQESCPI